MLPLGRSDSPLGLQPTDGVVLGSGRLDERGCHGFAQCLAVEHLAPHTGLAQFRGQPAGEGGQDPVHPVVPAASHRDGIGRAQRVQPDTDITVTDAGESGALAEGVGQLAEHRAVVRSGSALRYWVNT